MRSRWEIDGSITLCGQCSRANGGKPEITTVRRAPSFDGPGTSIRADRTVARQIPEPFRWSGQDLRIRDVSADEYDDGSRRGLWHGDHTRAVRRGFVIESSRHLGGGNMGILVLKKERVDS